MPRGRARVILPSGRPSRLAGVSIGTSALQTCERSLCLPSMRSMQFTGPLFRASSRGSTVGAGMRSMSTRHNHRLPHRANLNPKQSMSTRHSGADRGCVDRHERALRTQSMSTRHIACRGYIRQSRGCPPPHHVIQRATGTQPQASLRLWLKNVCPACLGRQVTGIVGVTYSRVEVQF